MSVFEHSRFRIFNSSQHPFSHDLSEFIYINDRLPGVVTVTDCLDYIVSVLYPNYVATVPTQASLPATANPNDYYFVSDDGDGRGAGYVWTVIDQVGQFVKRYDVDWSMDAILSETVTRTSYLYPAKYGMTDQDESGNPVTGLFAGQRIYGGDDNDQSLTLQANSTGVGGFIQFTSPLRPATSGIDLGTSAEPFQQVFSETLNVDTLELASGSVQDTTGAIDFGSCILTTTEALYAGSLEVSAHVQAGGLTLSSGSIEDGSGGISFGSTNLSTTGTVSAGLEGQFGTVTISDASITDSSGAIHFGSCSLYTTGAFVADAISASEASVGDLTLSGSGITAALGNLVLQAGLGSDIALASNVVGSDISLTGSVEAIGSGFFGSLELTNSTIASSVGSLVLDSADKIEVSQGVIPTDDNLLDLGESGGRFKKLWLSDAIGGSTEIKLSDLLTLRAAPYRNLARTVAAQDGDSLYWDAVNQAWLASRPDNEITHSEVGGLLTGDAGHTQFAMLAGRSGGQTLQGGTSASESLTLESTAHSTKGYVYTKDTLRPGVDASYSGGWQGIDLGGVSNRFRNVYATGEFRGFRFETANAASLPSASATTVGRAVFNTDSKKIQLDVGGTWTTAGSARFIQDLSFNGSDLTKDVDVSASIADARNAIWQLADNANSFERLQVPIQTLNATTVRITTSTPLPSGSYRLLGIE